MHSFTNDISIHLVQNLRHVTVDRSGESLTVRVGKATSRQEICLALESKLSARELEKVLSIWGDSDTPRTYALAHRTVIICEAPAGESLRAP